MLRYTAAALVVSLFVVSSWAATCSIVDNRDYDSNGNVLTLYSVPSPEACCDACAALTSECAAFSWVKVPNIENSNYCYLKNKRSAAVSSTGTKGGASSYTPPAVTTTCSGTEDNVDYSNGFLSQIANVASASACCQLCGSYTGCNYYTWVKSGAKTCYLKASKSNTIANTGVTSGSVLGTQATLRSGKRGLGWFDSRACTDLKLFSNVAWIYNWATQPEPLLQQCLRDTGIEYIPTIWGKNFDVNSIYASSKYLLTFNEPNFKSQSNISPKDAASYWPTIQAKADQLGMKIGSPSAAACGPASDCYNGELSPIGWFDQFFGNCTNCRVDFITTHIYTCSAAGVRNFLNGLKKYNKPIWLTEVACPAAGQPNSVEENFLTELRGYLDADSVFERYAWFGTRIKPSDGWLGPQVSLLNISYPALNNLGKIYNK